MDITINLQKVLYNGGTKISQWNCVFVCPQFTLMSSNSNVYFFCLYVLFYLVLLRVVIVYCLMVKSYTELY